jgi:hypothetical protein
MLTFDDCASRNAQTMRRQLVDRAGALLRFGNMP